MREGSPVQDAGSSTKRKLAGPGTPARPGSRRPGSTSRAVRLGPSAPSTDTSRTVLDSLQEHVAVLDHKGTILAVNRAWKEFARHNGDPLLRRSGVGVDYLSVCRTARGEDAPIAREAAAGILAVMRGERRGFSLEYPCHSPRKRRWFLMYVSRLLLPTPGAVVSHIDISRRREAEEALCQARDRLQEEVRRRTSKLARTKTTLEDEIVHRLQAERQLRDNERRLEQALRERERISQDLHDSVLQALYAIGLGLESSEPLVAGTSEDAARALRAAIEQLNLVIREVRGYIEGIEATFLERGDVIEGILALVELLGRQAGMRFLVTLSRTAVRTLSRDEARDLLQIASEAIGNAVRHSHARRVWVRLRRQGARLRLEIRDDGVGLKQGRSRSGRGLRNMARRARRLRGRVTVASEPAKGTRVIFEGPLPARTRPGPTRR